MCFVEPPQSFVKDFSGQVLNPKSDLVGNEKVVKLCKAFIKNMEDISSRRRVDSRAVPAFLVPELTLPVQITHFVANMYMNGVLYEKYRHIPLLRQSDK